MEAMRDPFEYGKRGPRGFLNLGRCVIFFEEQLRISSFFSL